MALHDCPDCTHAEAAPEGVVVAVPGTNEHDVAIATTAAEAEVAIAEVNAEARVAEAEIEAAARVDVVEEETDAVEAIAEAEGEAREAEAEARVAEAEAIAEVADAAADVAIAGAEGVVEEQGEGEAHVEPDGDEAPPVVAVMVPPQIQEGGRPATEHRARTVSRFAARRRH